MLKTLTPFETKTTQDQFISHIQAGDLFFLSHFFNEQFDPFFSDEIALSISIEEGNLNVVQFLVEKGFDIHRDNDHPLYLAVLNNQPLIAKYLLDLGCTIERCKENLFTWSIHACDLTMFELLHHYYRKDNFNKKITNEQEYVFDTYSILVAIDMEERGQDILDYLSFIYPAAYIEEQVIIAKSIRNDDLDSFLSSDYKKINIDDLNELFHLMFVQFSAINIFSYVEHHKLFHLSSESYKKALDPELLSYYEKKLVVNHLEQQLPIKEINHKTKLKM